MRRGKPLSSVQMTAIINFVAPAFYFRLQKMKNLLLYCLCTSMLLTISCSTPKEIFVTQEFEANNRSSEIRHVFVKEYLVQFLGYQSFRDSCITCSRVDSVLNMGIIFDKTTIEKYNDQRFMSFGNDSLTCVIRYHSATEFTTTDPSIIDLFPKRKRYDPPRESKTTQTGAKAEGIILYPGIDSGVSFFYQNHNGFLIAGKDSFILKPVYQGKSKLLATIIGVQLLKGDTAYGVIHSFTGLFRKKVFLYTRASEKEQFIVAAYFAVIAPLL